VLLLIFAILVILMATGMPVAFSFMLINVVGVFIFFSGTLGLEQLILSIYTSLATFILLPVMLFVLMGEVMFHSGIGLRVIDIMDKWLGRLPGRLSLLAVATGTVLAALTGVSMAATSILGSVLVPEMENRGYKKPMTMGPIMASGGLAIMIPPSSLAVLLGAIGEISVGRILVAIIIPGLLLAGIYIAYIIVRCMLQPRLAPAYEVAPTPLSVKVRETIQYVFPLAIVVFLVIGVMMLGVATPSEAAASGTIGIVIVALIYRCFTWEVIKKSILGTLRITGMIFMIVAGATAFSQILSYTGATQGLAQFATSLPVAPILIVIGMQIVVLILGCFMDVVAIMMITLPIFVPTIHALGFDPVWFGVLIMINIECALITPPFGMSLFVMKGVAPSGTTMGDIYKASLPFVIQQLLAMALIMVFPQIALWLPGLGR
jgi:tripartite ATP-independent transporter DctM subunit